jgi:hypothetical protein
MHAALAIRLFINSSLGAGMPAKYSRHVALTGPLARYVEDQVATLVPMPRPVR